MNSRRPIELALILLAIMPGWSRGADSPPVTALKDMGLTKSGHVFVIEAEKPVLEKMKDVRAVANGYADAADRQAAAEQLIYQIAQREERCAELQANVNEMNQRINQQSFLQQQQNTNGMGRNRAQQQQMAAAMSQLTTQRGQIQAGLNEVAQEQRTLKASALQPKARTALDDEVKTKAEDFKAALVELRPMVDEVTKKYTELAADPAVQAALAEIAKASKSLAKLGPSEAFTAAIKALDQAERRYLGKKPATAAKKAKAKARK